MPNIIINILRNLLPNDVSPGLCQGGLSLSCKVISTRAAAMAEFTSFGGSGWLCTAERRNIIVFREDGMPDKEAAEEWPLWGEAARGDVSRHLRRYDTGWQITTISKDASSKNILLQQKLLARSGPPLIYEISYTPEKVNAVAELRQSSYRFRGFLPQSGE